MFRTLVLCVPLLMIPAAAEADDAVAALPATHQEPAAKESAAKEPAKSHTDLKKEAATAAADVGKQEAKAGGEAKAATEAKAEGDVKMSGMSVLGNEEAPKSLVIVPWKSSQLGEMPGIARLVDDSTQPVDKEVFMRELAYYQIKTGAK